MTLKLPITKPKITSYWFYADLQIIINEVDPEGLFFMNHFIDLHSTGNLWCELYFSYEQLYYQMEMYMHCPFIQSMMINRRSEKADIDYIREAIQHGWYIIAYIDRVHIKEYNAVLGRHQIMIYGYDDIEGKLFYCDHDKNGRYITDMTTDYQSYLRAYEAIDEVPSISGEISFMNTFYLFKPKECWDYKLALSPITESLKFYLNLKTSEYERRACENNYFGQKTYDHMKQYFETLEREPAVLTTHMGNYAVLCDHKAIMKELLKKLCRMQLIDEESVNRYNNVVDKTMRLRNLVLKYNLTREMRLIQNIKNLIDDIHKTEYDILYLVLNMLEDKELIKNGGGL